MARAKSIMHNTSRTVDTVRHILRDICDRDLPGKTIIIDVQKSVNQRNLTLLKESEVQSAIQGMVCAGEIHLTEDYGEGHSSHSVDLRQSGLAMQNVDKSIATAIIYKRVGYRMS